MEWLEKRRIGDLEVTVFANDDRESYEFYVGGELCASQAYDGIRFGSEVPTYADQLSELFRERSEHAVRVYENRQVTKGNDMTLTYDEKCAAAERSQGLTPLRDILSEMDVPWRIEQTGGFVMVCEIYVGNGYLGVTRADGADPTSRDGWLVVYYDSADPQVEPNWEIIDWCASEVRLLDIIKEYQGTPCPPAGLVTFVVTASLSQNLGATRMALKKALESTNAVITDAQWVPDRDSIADAYGTDTITVDIIRP